MTLKFQMEPMIPSRLGGLADLALEVYKASARLSGRVHPVTAERIVRLLRNVNSYHSNLIEGHRTTLLDIETSLRESSEDEKTRDQQLLHRQNVLAQSAIEGECEVDDVEITSTDFLCRLHDLLFKELPREFLVQQDEQGKCEVVMTPGTLRDRDVRVGGHIPPSSSSLPKLLERFHEAYSLTSLQGTDYLVCAAASHHRLLWIHPFLEGNGRVARLFTDIYLKCTGLEGYGLWTLCRGLARREAEYKSLLAGADARRQGDYDGRGNLSEEGLRRFCTFFLETALDQACFMDELLKLDSAEKNIEWYCSSRTSGRLAGKAPLPKETARILSHTFVHGCLTKGEVHKLIGTSDRKAREVVKVLLSEGLLESGNQKAPLTMGFPSGAVQYIFPELCDSGAY